MIKRKRGLSKSERKIIVATFIVALATAIFGVWFLEIRSPLGIIEAITITVLVGGGSQVLSLLLISIFTFEIASERERRAEDDILLQATAFSQAALWIYLNLIPENAMILFLKLLVPSSAILFYCMRAYAKLKESNLWRYRSIYALLFVLSFSLVAFIMIFWESLSSTYFLIEGKPNFGNYIAAPIFTIPFSLALLCKNELKHRYALTDD